VKSHVILAPPNLDRRVRKQPELQARLHVLHLHGKVVTVELSAEDGLQILAKTLRSIDRDVESRHIRGNEEWESLNVVPVRVSDEEMAVCASFPLMIWNPRSRMPLPASKMRISSPRFRAMHDVFATMPHVAPARRGRGATSSPKREMRALTAERRTIGLRGRFTRDGHGGGPMPQNQRPLFERAPRCHWI